VLPLSPASIQCYLIEDSQQTIWVSSPFDPHLLDRHRAEFSWTEEQAAQNGNRLKHSVEAGRFPCLECSQTFGRVEHLTRHSRSHMKEHFLKCSHCRKGFYRMSVIYPCLFHRSNFNFHCVFGSSSSSSVLTARRFSLLWILPRTMVL